MNQRTTIARAPRLVIFDCDGVLVDSEPISNRVLAIDISAAGWPMTTAQCIARFKGGQLIEVQREVERHLGVSLGETWLAVHYERMFDAFRKEITAIPGVLDVLDMLKAQNIPFCVASQGPLRKMQITLGATGIWPLVEGHVYSADMVERPKPAPDLFLHAARSEGFEPAHCIVIEDSATGVRAACAAGMRVVGYGAEETEALAAAGAGSIISDMASLMPLILRGEIA
ncbi:MAG: HAD family hydrolase [Rhodospirillaceae bacterium]|nr:HAD family hydrolase [Rhodospirillaceae bacterium]